MKEIQIFGVHNCIRESSWREFKRESA